MIVLDTHVWLWWVTEPERLSARAAKAIDGSEAIGVSAMSCWEVAMLNAAGRVRLDRPPRQWVAAALGADTRLRAVPADADIAVTAALLGEEGFHRDPADRLIYATARHRGATLVSRDRAMREFDDQVIW